MPWADLLATALRIGWKPADLWSATLYELETAIWLALPDAQRSPGDSEDDLRAFFKSRTA